MAGWPTLGGKLLSGYVIVIGCFVANAFAY